MGRDKFPNNMHAHGGAGQTFAGAVSQSCECMNVVGVVVMLVLMFLMRTIH